MEIHCTEPQLFGYHVSNVERLIPAEELDFPPCKAFEHYAQYMHPDAVVHPAKFNVYLVEYLIRHYTRMDDIVLDPFAGTGILGVIAALHGRNAIQVEIEPLFYEWMEYAKDKVEKTQIFGKKGWIHNILGDARQLTSLLQQYVGKIDCVITSPPYAETISRSGGPPSYMIRSGQFKIGKSCLSMRQYSPNPSNIGNLRLGDTKILEQIATTNKVPNEDIENIRRRLMKGRESTYLSEMLKVYREIHNIVKPSGNTIDLPYITYLLCKLTGLNPVKVMKYKLKTMSFYRIMQKRRFQEKGLEFPKLLEYEYILVFKK